MTKDEWRERYYQRLRDSGIDEELANEAADVGLVVEEESEGPDIVNWEPPESAADEEMSCWDD